MKITKTLKVELDQADVEQAVRDFITKSDPTITVKSIEFTQRRNPTRLDVDVNAYYGDQPEGDTDADRQEAYGDSEEPVNEEVKTEKEEPTSTEETEPVESLQEEGTEEAVDDTQPESIADIFGGG